MTQESTAKKNTQKLQRAIVDGLEDVKGQDIQVFDTEHLSPLFERVIVVSGTSNRQTKALAASVRDAVRDAGFPKPRIEGESNGEWIIVDCAQVVVHIMQPNFRSYYHLEELWGEKPVRLRLGAAKPAAKAAPAPARKAAPVSAGKRPSPARAAPRPLMPDVAPQDMPPPPRPRAAARTAAKSAAPAKAPAAKPVGTKAASAKPAAAKKSAAGKPAAKTTPRKAPARKVPAAPR